MHPPPLMPQQCPSCPQVFVTSQLLDRHFKLDHTPAGDGDLLTVDDILAVPVAEEPVPAAAGGDAGPRRVEPSLTTLVGRVVAQPWALAVAVWVAVVYGLSHLGMSVGDLVLGSLLVAVVAGLVALRLWALHEVRQQESLRRDGPRT